MSVKKPGGFSVLMTLLIVLMTAAGLAMLKGWGTDIEWYPKAEPRPAPPKQVAPVVTTSLPLQAYSEIWNRSLFNQDRAADPIAPALNVETSAPVLNGLSLTGVVISPSLHKAFFKTAEGKSLGLLKGESLPNGWVVDKIESGKVSLSFKSTQQDLMLPVLKVPNAALR